MTQTNFCMKDWASGLGWRGLLGGGKAWAPSSRLLKFSTEEGKDKPSRKHQGSEHGSHGVGGGGQEILKCGLCLGPAGSGGRVRTRGCEDGLGVRPQWTLCALIFFKEPSDNV